MSTPTSPQSLLSSRLGAAVRDLPQYRFDSDQSTLPPQSDGRVTPQVVDVIVSSSVRRGSVSEGTAAPRTRDARGGGWGVAGGADARLYEQELRNSVREQHRLEDLNRQLSEQLRKKAEEHAAEREGLSSERQQLLERARAAEAARAEAEKELAKSFDERQRLAERAEHLRQQAESLLTDLHSAQDAADQSQTRYEREKAERESDAVELQALRARHDFQERYSRAVTQQRDKILECARKLHARCAEGGHSLPPFDDVTEPPARHETPQRYEQPVRYEPQFTPPPPVPPPAQPETHHRYEFPVEPLSPPASPGSCASAQQAAQIATLGHKVERLAAEIATSRVEGSVVRRDYLAEAAARLDSACDGLYQLRGATESLLADIDSGRGAWGDSGDAGLEEEELRRCRDARRRSEVKGQMSRVLNQSGVDEETAAALEVYLSSARARDAITSATELFRRVRIAAEGRVSSARRAAAASRADLDKALEHSVTTAQAQADGLRVCQDDARGREAALLEMTEAKLRAEQQAAELRQQISERSSYVAQVERLSDRIAQGAEEEQRRVSAVVKDIEERHLSDVRRLQEEWEKRGSAREKDHREEVARSAEEAQQLRDEVASLRTALEEAGRTRDQQRAKRKSEKAAREELERERAGLREQLSAQGYQLKESRTRLRDLDKENAVLRELTGRLQADVMRGQIMLESEEERKAFEVWRRSGSLAPAQGSARRLLPSQDDRSSTATARGYRGASFPRAMRPG
eukprot:TRINITY_DN5596_c0_g1_i1.p1 TRINITY_DN5596_c0_g1~~TRINITY_DN5596_c0_g1_i1.p1  ORF type:complete len:750 (+),score=260.00 TRINITY_DN5596_c0_g1_i1:72-2321(+)